MLVAALFLMSALPAAALDLNPADYFKLSYKPFTFDKTEITGSEAFHVTVTGHITCVQDLPALLPVREAVATSQVIARHTTSGSEVTLNPSYTINVKPFPDREGDTIEISQTVPLQFPVQSASGNYTIIGRILETKVKFIIGSMDVTGYLPQEQPMGTVTFTAPETAPAPSPEPAAEEDAPSTPPSSPIPPAEPEPVPGPAIAAPSPTSEPEQIIPWWVGLVVFVAIAVTVLNVAWFISQWPKKR